MTDHPLAGRRTEPTISVSGVGNRCARGMNARPASGPRLGHPWATLACRTAIGGHRPPLCLLCPMIRGNDQRRRPDGSGPRARIPRHERCRGHANPDPRADGPRAAGDRADRGPRPGCRRGARTLRLRAGGRRRPHGAARGAASPGQGGPRRHRGPAQRPARDRRRLSVRTGRVLRHRRRLGRGVPAGRGGGVAAVAG